MRYSSFSTGYGMEKIVVLDFGGQYSHLIAKRARYLGYYSEIALPSISKNDPKMKDVAGVVLSGGPSSVYDKDIPEFNSDILNLDVPILGLCYGHQLLSKEYRGVVRRAAVGEFGVVELTNVAESPLFDGVTFPTQVWTSNNDEVTELPPGFEIIGSTKNCRIAAIQNLEKKRFGIQFHAEVRDTLEGDKILGNFIKFCGMKKNWDTAKIKEIILEDIKRDAGDKKALLFLSGGVDSTVAFALLNAALGKDRVLGLHIDNGFMRMNESAAIDERYKKFGFTNYIIEDASEEFLKAVKNITDPQEKRKRVGETYINVRNRVVDRLKLPFDDWLLAQGTLYPDIIESGGTKHSKTIKTHHNRVDGIQKLIDAGLVIEPLKDLYKDEVRAVGRALGLSEELVGRHPFPGPGLSINVLCSDGVIKEVELYEKTNKFLKELNIASISKEIKDIYAIPIKSVGVHGDIRTYAYPAALDMGEFYKKAIDWDEIEKISFFITNKVKEVNRTILKIYEKQGLSLIEGYCDKKRLDMTRIADEIVLSALKKYGWYNKIFQHLTINLPYATKRDNCSVVLRPVVSEDVMTAKFARLDQKLLSAIVDELRKIDFIDAVYYDATNKPPATFGWE
jgi:GMP synthase (glutamine-hydrolysing)